MHPFPSLSERRKETVHIRETVHLHLEKATMYIYSLTRGACLLFCSLSLNDLKRPNQLGISQSISMLSCYVDNIMQHGLVEQEVASMSHALVKHWLYRGSDSNLFSEFPSQLVEALWLLSNQLFHLANLASFLSCNCQSQEQSLINCLSFNLDLRNGFPGAPGWLSQWGIQLQVGSRVRGFESPHWAPLLTVQSLLGILALSLSLCPSSTLSLSLKINKL